MYFIIKRQLRSDDYIKFLLRSLTSAQLAELNKRVNRRERERERDEGSREEENNVFSGRMKRGTAANKMGNRAHCSYYSLHVSYVVFTPLNSPCQCLQRCENKAVK